MTALSGHYEVIVIGGGPAGLSAALNLVRFRRKTLVIDSNRPRHAATMMSHGFLTRDGTPPAELRRMGREEFLSYPGGTFQQAIVTSLVPVPAAEVSDLQHVALGTIQSDGPSVLNYRGASRIQAAGTAGWAVQAAGFNGQPDLDVTADVVLLTTGLKEELPNFPSIRNFYGMSIFSCIECDGYELRDRPLGLFGTTSDLAKRALLVHRFTDDLTVFTLGSDAITELQHSLLGERGIAVETGTVVDLVGQQRLEGVQMSDDRVLPIQGGLIRPRWVDQLEYLSDTVAPDVDDWGLLRTDRDGRTNIPGLYAAGDLTSPGPQQLIVAAGAGARVATTMSRDLIQL